KAYPTVRELELARLMGEQGIVSSICPIHVSEQGQGDPLYGYRPAVASIIERLKNALTNQCVPQKLTPDPNTGLVPCLVLEVMPPRRPAGDSGTGVKDPDRAVVSKFRQNLMMQAGVGASGVGPIGTVCEVIQTASTPAGTTPAGVALQCPANPGWCYSQNV